MIGILRARITRAHDAEGARLSPGSLRAVRRAVVIVVGLVAALLAGTPAPAALPAACRVHVGTFAKKRHPRPPLVLGDSTLIFAAPRLARRGLDADAQGCRQFGQGMLLLRARKRARTLPRVVVMTLGANASVSERELGWAWHLVGPHRKLVLVTPLETGGVESSDAANERREARRRPRRIVLLDWVRYSRGHPGWFASDGLHLTFTGAEAQARFIARGVGSRAR